MLSDVPVGLFLSGGIDSTALAAVLQAQGQDLQTFSLTFEEAAFSEQAFSREAATALHTHHTDVTLRVSDALHAVPSFLDALDQPTIDGLNTYLISHHARKAGLKVALSGLGGDELFGGYSGFNNIQRGSQAMRWLPDALGAALSTAIRSSLPEQHRTSKLASALRSRGDVAQLYALSRELFNQDWQARLSSQPRLPPASLISTDGFAAGDMHDRPIFDQVSVLELRNFALNTLLRDSDVMSMAASLELRIPFFDTDLVDLILSLPAKYKTEGPGLKPLLAAAVQDSVPKSILLRKKQGFELPFAVWLRNDMRQEMETTLLDSSPAVNGSLSRPAIARLWQDFLDGRTSWSRPWALYVLIQWYARAQSASCNLRPVS